MIVSVILHPMGECSLPDKPRPLSCYRQHNATRAGLLSKTSILRGNGSEVVRVHLTSEVCMKVCCKLTQNSSADSISIEELGRRLSLDRYISHNACYNRRACFGSCY
jgi:hypothetical protein